MDNLISFDEKLLLFQIINAFRITTFVDVFNKINSLISENSESFELSVLNDLKSSLLHITPNEFNNIDFSEISDFINNTNMEE